MEEKQNNIIFTDEEGLVTITLDRQPLNILSLEMLQDINERLAELQFRSDVKLIQFCANGDIFSAGLSMEQHNGEMAYHLINEFHRLFGLLHGIPIPILAVVQGPALGGACELVAYCDLAIAGEKAKFGQPEIKVGVFPTVATVLYPYIMGKKRAMELILTGTIISAKQALELNMINKVVPDASLESEAKNIIDALLAHSSVVVQYTKQALINSRLLEFTEALRTVEDIYLTQLLQTLDAQEGIRAFLEKRKAQWENK
ncbi:MAG: hypothetical protein A2Y62_15600 [Candidatus Fischerbacteria bacterium RBG_13_37_8]|uniref:Enoyl-CoA hydratase n=1 Tax=Candidatus Fischerbacteria bacterium RBG_13_37_8 TaxID=1817863 RepID=A0A1F5VKU7_9BACT|nr:MAG: hypothetical protein A2Y62_15600 [Candidatus Fischerbacteria bacterium RBG_13_37_8]